MHPVWQLTTTAITDAHRKPRMLHILHDKFASLPGFSLITQPFTQRKHLDKQKNGIGAYPLCLVDFFSIRKQIRATGGQHFNCPPPKDYLVTAESNLRKIKILKTRRLAQTIVQPSATVLLGLRSSR